eukprot:15176397-Ditylum_brightwellii.AAC.1
MDQLGQQPLHSTAITKQLGLVAHHILALTVDVSGTRNIVTLRRFDVALALKIALEWCHTTDWFRNALTPC